jgi:hypothetical protein
MDGPEFPKYRGHSDPVSRYAISVTTRTLFQLGAAFALASFVRANTTPSQIRVRLFVPRTATVAPETEVDIDRICPRTAP